MKEQIEEMAKAITIFDFIKAIKADVDVIKIITGDKHAIHIHRDADNDFKEKIAKVILDVSADKYEINYSSKTKTLQVFIQMSLSQIDHEFGLTKSGAE